MGAQTFCERVKGASAKKAFRDAVDQAKYDHGHSGYSGTIAEKDSFVMITCPDGIKPERYADQLLDDAGCIDCGNGEYLFFGWASS
jgi:hypothetical protein